MSSFGFLLLRKDTMRVSTFMKEAISLQLAYSFRNLVHLHSGGTWRGGCTGGHGAGGAEILICRQQKVNCLPLWV